MKRNAAAQHQGVEMNHHEALHTKAAERYLLGEMDERERFDFEDHYFACHECADDLRTANTFIAGVKADCATEEQTQPRARPAAIQHGSTGWLDWLRAPAFVPAMAALLLGCLASYQALVLIPSIRGGVAARAIAPVVLRAAARGEDAPLVERKGDLSVLSLDVNAADPGASLHFEITPAQG